MLEGLEETVTVKRFGISGALAKTLRTTKPIENLNGVLRRISRRVKRWRDGRRVLRWAAAGVLEAEKNFRRIKGCKSMPSLLTALREQDAQLASDSVSRIA